MVDVSSAMRSARLEARTTPDVQEMVRRAASLEGRSVSEFMVTAAVEAARRTIRENEVIELSREASLAFANALISPPPLTPAMQQALSRHDALRRG